MALVYQRGGRLKLHTLVQVQVELGQLKLTGNLGAAASHLLHLLNSRYLLLKLQRGRIAANQGRFAGFATLGASSCRRLLSTGTSYRDTLKHIHGALGQRLVHIYAVLLLGDGG